MHLTEKIIIIGVWLISIISIFFIPKKRSREALFIFLFAQLPSWILGLIVVQLDWIEYPVRELREANSTSFSFEYFVLPIMCIFFNLYYPNTKSIYKKVLYYVAFISFFTLLEYLVSRHTAIIDYIHWEWYWTLLSMIVVFYFIRVVYKWFFNIGKPFSI